MKVPGSEQLEKCWGMSHQRQSRVQNNHTHHGWKKRRRDETNELAKSCGVLHVVTCREPAGLDQSLEAGSNTEGNVTKPFGPIIFGGYPNSFKSNKFKRGSKRQLIETQRTRSHKPCIHYNGSNNSFRWLSFWWEPSGRGEIAQYAEVTWKTWKAKTPEHFTDLGAPGI